MAAIPNITYGEEIGGGTFGKVYRARHGTLDLDVAVKVIQVGHLADVAGVLKEARLMARLDHPNLLRIFDAGHAGDCLYLVLELMDATCSGYRSVEADRALDLTLQLLAGLQSLHDARVLHRDIKPANCLVRARDNRVKLADLGLAVEETSRTRPPLDVAGTLPFMAPELFEYPPRFGPASDLYALGVTLQCMLLSENPYPRAYSEQEMISWIREGTRASLSSRRPDLPRSFSTLVDRMCAPSPSDRPSQAAEAIAALAPVLQPTGMPAGPDAPPATIGPWIVGTQILGDDANFRQFAVSHARTGAAARLAMLKRRCPLSRTSPLILASAERASRLSHRGIADVVDWGMHAERAYVVTRAQGRSLKTIVEAGGPLEELEAVELARDLAEALIYLHENELVYQVVNPAFAFAGSDGRSAQLAWPMFCVKTGSTHIDPSAAGGAENPAALLISVPLFAAPEVLWRPARRYDQPAAPRDSGAPATIGRYEVIGSLPGDAPSASVRITERVDLYGLGEILFYLIAGVAAFAVTPEVPGLVFAKLQGPARLRERAPSATAATASLVAELTDPQAERRPTSAKEVRERLDRIARNLRG